MNVAPTTSIANSFVIERPTIQYMETGHNIAVTVNQEILMLLIRKLRVNGCTGTWTQFVLMEILTCCYKMNWNGAWNTLLPCCAHVTELHILHMEVYA
jgi:hypothetical protein